MGSRGSTSASGKKASLSRKDAESKLRYSATYMASEDYKAPQQLRKTQSEQEIIDKLGGPDQTRGSCSSLALAYAANRVGLDVTDYRGGSSQDYFSNRSFVYATLFNEGVADVKQKEDYNDVRASKELIKSMEKGKEYILASGRHAAVIRKGADGKLQYLELQGDRGENTWVTPTAKEFKDRFVLKTSHTNYGVHTYYNNYLVEVSSLKSSQVFIAMTGFINTEKDKQQKGSGGSIK